MNMEPWKEAVKEEMGALEKNNTWKVVSLSQRKRIIRCKWIFTIKYRANGNIGEVQGEACSKEIHSNIWV